ncbi:MAG TPA: Ig domain-containing protein, partial [Janthinobacterium sp.]|nr:Ig domain-containing protein [Janthinobacterium sp.]
SSIASILLTSSAGSLQSGSSAGVNLVALVKDVNNTVVKSALITFSADSGALLQSQVSTDDKGLATVALTTGNDPTLRTITVTADAGGGQKTTSLISVVGTKVSLSATNSVKVGASSSMTVKLVDSNNIGLAGKAVSFTSAANAVIAVKGGGAAVTDSSGQLILTYTAPAATPSSGSDVITVKAGGDTTSSTVAINSSNFTINAVNGTAIQTSAAINVCQPIAVHDDLGGAPLAGSVVGITTSLGNIYSDNVCTLTVTPFVFNGTGDATAYVLATSPGVAALQAAAGGATVTGTIEFVAPLTASATVNVQASPAVLGVNLAGSSTQQSTLSATVLDGTAQNNRVKNAFVSFSVVSDASGGSLTSPATVLTGSDGVATVNYIAGSTNTALNGVQIKAAIQGGVSNASNVVNLTVARAVSITAGTGNTVATPDSTTYRLDYSVSVTDSTGAAVADVKLDALVRPRSYKKGALQYQLPSGPWLPVTSATCLNEDTDNTGIYSVIKDTNRNGFLDPGLPVTITPHVTTDVNGRAIISLTYTRDRANWIDVDFTIRGTVAGTESTYTGYTVLPYLASDFSNLAISPPGRFSPYGQDSVCTDSN